MNKDYEQVLAKANAASAEFRNAQQAYRSRKIGDAEFLAARKAYDESEIEFSKARGEYVEQV